jgi:hypothetical protein
MATVAKSYVGVDTNSIMYIPQVSGDIFAGEAIDAGAACYIKASDGKAYMSTGTAVNEAAKVDGFSVKPYGIGEAVTLFQIGTKLHWCKTPSLTIGADLYLDTTKGQLSDTPTTGGLKPIARVYRTTHIQVRALV